MKRSHRAAVTLVAASAVLTGGGVALAYGPLAVKVSANPVAAAEAAGLALDPGPAADPSRLHDAVTRLTREVAALTGELDTARHDRELASAAAAKAEASAAAAALASASKQAAGTAVVRRATSKAPAVHATTGASTAKGESESEPGND
jgi:hypothetical protein